MKSFVTTFVFALLFAACTAQHHKSDSQSQSAQAVLTGASQLDVYLPLLKGKRVGIFANQTSIVGNTNIVDTLQKLGVSVTLIFGPEHGFRGIADAGEKIGNYTDEKTGVPVISLYGNKRSPSSDELKKVDILIFDIQDVGARFYTYISSLQDYMEAAFLNNKPLLLLDRPNPNGFYVDGPILDPRFKSFVGVNAVPIVYGMTIGEYASMIAGENWLSPDANIRYASFQTKTISSDSPFHFLVIKCRNYTHDTRYILPVRPSPNLPEMQSIYLYPSTCLFEGTILSEGRGTDKPFQVFGHPLYPKSMYSFTPQPNEGAKSSKHYFEVCYGWSLHGTNDEVLKELDRHIQIKWLIEAYNQFPGKDSFFLKGFNRLAGNDVLMQQIKDGKSEQDIRASWEPALNAFKMIRKKYLLYPDFKQ